MCITYSIAQQWSVAPDALRADDEAHGACALRLVGGSLVLARVATAPLVTNGSESDSFFTSAPAEPPSAESSTRTRHGWLGWLG